MIRVLAAGAVAAMWAAAAWQLGQGLFRSPLFLRRNVRQVEVPVAVGALAILGAIAAAATFHVVDAFADHDPAWAIDPELAAVENALFAVMPVALGFALLGLIDDLLGDHGDKGFTGHLRALRQGRLTTGGLKLVGGGLLALATTSPYGGIGRLLLGAGVIALGANAANLFDRAPGRATKVGLVATVAVVAAGSHADRLNVAGMVAVVGGIVGLLAFELREELMLGDTGSNALGAVIGWSVVVTTGWQVQLGVLVGLIVLNLAGERISFSGVIDRVAPLRVLDRIGRKPL